MRPDFYIHRTDRLAARLRHILYAWRFTRKVGAKLHVCWPPHDRATAGLSTTERYDASLVWNLDALAAENGEEIVFLPSEPPVGPSYRDIEQEDGLASMRPHAFQYEFLDRFDGQDVAFLGKSYAFRYAGETKNGVFDEMRLLYRQLALQPSVAVGITHALNEIGEAFHALHVRRGDIPAVLQRCRPALARGVVSPKALRYAIHAAKQTAPLRFYYSFLDEALAKRQKIVFFSDSPSLYSHFAERYGAKQIVDGSVLGRELAHPLQKAALDFTLLTRSEAIIGTQTGFASVAAILGGISLHNASARGSLEEFRSFFFEDLLRSAEMSEEVRERLFAAVRPQYDKYRAQAERIGVALDMDET